MTHTYEKEITALLVVDPYNDFISEGGKIWPRIRAVAEANSCVAHMLQLLTAARKAKLRVFYAMHHRYRPGDYATWKYIAPVQKAAWEHKSFEYDAVDGSSTGTRVPWMWGLIKLPRFGGATHANHYDNRSRHRKISVSGARR
jgi:nicotinamidase-related amidase